MPRQCVTKLLNIRPEYVARINFIRININCIHRILKAFKSYTSNWKSRSECSLGLRLQLFSPTHIMRSWVRTSVEALISVYARSGLAVPPVCWIKKLKWIVKDPTLCCRDVIVTIMRNGIYYSHSLFTIQKCCALILLFLADCLAYQRIVWIQCLLVW
jgi:hypothetical protein